MKNDPETTALLLICLGFFVSKLAYSYNHLMGLASIILFTTFFLQQFDGIAFFDRVKLIYLKLTQKK